MDSDYAWQQQQLTKTKEVRVNDPFARRPCQPTPLAFSKDPPNKETPASVASPQKGTAAPTPVPTPPPKEQKVEHDDPYSIHNELDLDLDIDVTGCCFFCFFFLFFSRCCFWLTLSLSLWQQNPLLSSLVWAPPRNPAPCLHAPPLCPDSNKIKGCSESD